MKRMKIEYLATTDLIPYENNPRLNDGAVDAVAASIKEFGFQVPIVIDKDNVIVAGHTRLKAAEKLGITEVPCTRADDLTDEQIKAYRLADNKVGELAVWDFEKLDVELGELADLDIEMSQFGFNEIYSPDEFGEEFSLPDGDKPEICSMTFVLHRKQKELIDKALKAVEDNITQTFGNINSAGNALYEVIREWDERKK